MQRQTDCVKVCRDRSAQGNIVLKYAETDCVKVCRGRQIVLKYADTDQLKVTLCSNVQRQPVL